MHTKPQYVTKCDLHARNTNEVRLYREYGYIPKKRTPLTGRRIPKFNYTQKSIWGLGLSRYAYSFFVKREAYNYTANS